MNLKSKISLFLKKYFDSRMYRFSPLPMKLGGGGGEEEEEGRLVGFGWHWSEDIYNI